MHPVIRIVSFLIFAAALSFGAAAQLGLGAALVLLLLYLSRASVAPGLRMLRRLRWLLASILVVYLWFTPGAPLLPGWDAPWLPTREGLASGALRVGMLALIVLAVALLVELTPRERLLGALYWLSTPLRRVGIARERFALRLMLALEAVPVLQQELGARYRAVRGRESRLAAAAASAAGAFEAALHHAETSPCGVRELHLPPAPRLREWLYPAALAAAFWAVGQF